MLFTNRASNKNLNRIPAWQIRGSTIDVITSSDTGTSSVGWKSEAEPNVLANKMASFLAPPSLPNISPSDSSTQTLTNKFESCGVCFDKQHHTLDYLHILNEGKKRLVYLKMANFRRLHPREAVTHSATVRAYLEARWGYCKINKNRPSFLMEMRLGASKQQNPQPLKI